MSDNILSEKDIKVLGCLLQELSKEIDNGNHFDTIVVPKGTFDFSYSELRVSDRVKVLVRDSRLFTNGQAFFLNSKSSFLPQER